MQFWGNDIVALEDPLFKESNRLKRWMNKVCTEREKAILYASADWHLARWSLWACKESVYKVLIKCGVPPFLNPQSIEICPNDTLSAGILSFKAYYKERELFGYATSSKHWAYSVCSNYPFEKGDYESAIVSGTELGAGERIRTQLIMDVKRAYGIHINSIVQSDWNIPVVICSNPAISIDLSLSHHAPYSAYLYQICPLN